MQEHSELDFVQLKLQIRILKEPSFWGLLFILFFLSQFVFPNEYNLILISIDTLRPDFLGFYGRNPSPSPFLDELSKKSFVFYNARTPVPLTLPSHCTIFTGLYPFNHNIRDNGRGSLSKEILTISSFFKSKGYKNYALIGSYVLSSRFGLASHFDIYDDFVYKDGEEKVTFAFKERDAKRVVENSLKIFEKIERDKPYFFFIHFFDCHAPYKRHNISAKFNAYEEEIAYVDRAIKNLFESLEDGKTIWVFLSDHGEAFGEHNEYSHGFLTYETTLKVLFMIYAPFIKAGKSFEDVSTIDVFPTILDIFGEKISTDGISLLPVIKGGKIKERELFFESYYSSINFGTKPIYGLYKGEKKYIFPEPIEVYDLKNDKSESRNIFNKRDIELKEIKKSAEKILKDSKIQDLDEETYKNLRALGYLVAKKKEKEKDISPKEVFNLYKKISEYRDNFFKRKANFPFAKYEEFLKNFPEASFLSLELGMGYMQKGDNEKAIYWLKEALKYDPELIEGWLDLGNIYFISRNFEEAENCYKKAIKLDPNFPYPYLFLGKIYYDKGDKKNALKFWEKFFILCPMDENVEIIKKLVNIGGDK